MPGRVAGGGRGTDRTTAALDQGPLGCNLLHQQERIIIIIITADCSLDCFRRPSVCRSAPAVGTARSIGLARPKYWSCDPLSFVLLPLRLKFFLEYPCLYFPTRMRPLLSSSPPPVRLRGTATAPATASVANLDLKICSPPSAPLGAFSYTTKNTGAQAPNLDLVRPYLISRP